MSALPDDGLEDHGEGVTPLEEFVYRDVPRVVKATTVVLAAMLVAFVAFVVWDLS